jgi:hypothetical protein
MVEAAGTTVMVPLRVMATAANINQKRKKRLLGAFSFFRKFGRNPS